MKFGAKFRSYAVPEWQQYYVDYQCLKSLLKQQKKKIEASSDAPGYLSKLLPARWQYGAPPYASYVANTSALALLSKYAVGAGAAAASSMPFSSEFGSWLPVGFPVVGFRLRVWRELLRMPQHQVSIWGAMSSKAWR